MQVDVEAVACHVAMEYQETVTAAACRGQAGSSGGGSGERRCFWQFVYEQFRSETARNIFCYIS